MNFEAVFKLLFENFGKAKIDFALIGGFALRASGYARATQDIDFLINQEDARKVKALLLSFGYELLHESEDVLNFASQLGELGRVDFLLAHRRYAKAMLSRAVPQMVFDGKFEIKVISLEDQIGLKVQSSANNPKRYLQDVADIEQVIRLHRNKLDLNLLREYFSLFNRESELEQLLERTK